MRPGTMRGYQADIDGQNQCTGQNYKEKGLTIFALREQVTRVENGKSPQMIARLGGTNDLASVIKNEDFNEYHLVVCGNVFMHSQNGRVMSMVLDEDEKNWKFNGLLGVQVHVGRPMKIECRNFQLKKLPNG